jgi:hypothetical protein
MTFRDTGDQGGLVLLRRVYRRVPGKLRKWLMVLLAVVLVFSLVEYEESAPGPPGPRRPLPALGDAGATAQMATFLQSHQSLSAKQAFRLSHELLAMGISTPSEFNTLAAIFRSAGVNSKVDSSHAAAAAAATDADDDDDDEDDSAAPITLNTSAHADNAGSKQAAHGVSGSAAPAGEEEGEGEEEEEEEEEEEDDDGDGAADDETVAQLQKDQEQAEAESLQHLWDLADRSQKGYLRHGEVRSVMKAAGKEVGYEVFKAAMRQIDHDNTGQVHFDQFLAWWHSDAEEHSHEAGHDQTDMFGNAKVEDDKDSSEEDTSGDAGSPSDAGGGYPIPTSNGFAGVVHNNKGATGASCVASGSDVIKKAAVAEIGRYPGTAQGAVVRSVRGGNGKACAAHYKQTRPCCGQAGNAVTIQYQCSQQEPTCKGYVYNSAYGQCAGSVSSATHANTSQRKKALLPTLHQMLLGSDEALTVGKGLLQYEDTFKAQGWTTPSALMTLSEDSLLKAGLKSNDVTLLQEQVQAFIRFQVGASMPREINDSMFCKAKERNGFRLKPHGSTAAASCVAPDELVPPTGTKKPMLAICIPTRSSRTWRSVQDTNLFSVLLPSIGVYSPVNLCTRHCFD